MVFGPLFAQDVLGISLSYSLATDGAPQHGMVTINPDGSYTYVPSSKYNGPDTFTFPASDGRGGTSTATVSIDLVPVNDAPVAQENTVSGLADETLFGQ